MIVRWRFVSVLGLATTISCASGTSAPRVGPRPLPPDSAAMLAAALPQVRPAFRTQEEALDARHYAGATNPQRFAPSAAAPRPSSSPGSFTIQVASYRDLLLAEQAAELARRRFPELDVHIEESHDLVRVSVGGWASSAAAHARLATVLTFYPDAWIRSRSSP